MNMSSLSRKIALQWKDWQHLGGVHGKYYTSDSLYAASGSGTSWMST
jgi:hypothetical protein